MTQDLFFKVVSNRVRKICTDFDCTCSSSSSASCIYVYGRLTVDGRFVIPAILLDTLRSITDINLVSVSVDKGGRLYASFFVIKDISHGNSD